jgi:hypothetical protein
MAKASPIFSALNGGEWSPMLDGRTDIAGYAASASTLVNFWPTIQGPIIRRAGSQFVRQVKDVTDVTRLVPFIKARDDAVMIEFGDLYCRFYSDRAPVLTGSGNAITGATQADPVVVTTSGAHGYSNGQDVYISGVVGMTQLNGRWFKCANVTSTTFELQTIHGTDVDGTGYTAYTSGGTVDKPYEIVSPYSASDLSNSKGELGIDYIQRGDVVYITDRSGVKAPRKLSRSSATSWAFSTLEPGEGPFLSVNATATTMYVSGATGTITITASASVFTADDVGSLIRIDQEVVTATAPWVTGTAYTAGNYVRSEGKEYKAANSATSGTTIPSHTSGTVSDGGVNWEYISAGYGIARITAQSGTTATATVIVPFPQTLVGSGNASTIWQRGAWSLRNGYPTAVSFYRERLVFGQGTRLDMSNAADYENFALDVAGEVLPESAISVDVPGPANDIVGLQEGTALAVMTEGGEFAVAVQSSSEPLGPNNVQASGQTNYGARPVKPVRVGESILFVQSSGRKVRAMEYSWEREAFVAPDMTIRADHIVRDGVVRLARQDSPYAMILAVRADGTLLSFTFDQGQEARAWSRHEIGTVEDVAVIPSPDGTRDDVWLSVKRTINGGTRRYIEYLAAEHDTGDVQEDARYADCMLTYDGSSASTLLGFDHLEGETVGLLIDGASSPSATVTAGAITLPRAGEVVQAGLAYRSSYVSARIDAGAADGTSQGKTKRITDCAFRVIDTLGGEAGPSLSNLDEIPALNYRSPSTVMGDPPPLYTGDVLLSWPGGYETDGRIAFSTNTLFPATVVAIMPQVVTEESR